MEKLSTEIVTRVKFLLPLFECGKKDILREFMVFFKFQLLYIPFSLKIMQALEAVFVQIRICLLLPIY